jgi:hypothetical protein
VCKSTHRAALAADKEGKSLDYKRLQNAVNLLQESFSRTFNDRKELRPGFAFDEEGSKKAGVLAIVNELFAIYFRLNTLRLCKNLVRPVETRKLHEQGTMGQMVTYRYFTGRLALFEDQFALAEENLEFAFQNCHKDANKNKELILHYLIPIKLYRGRYPSPDRKYLCSGGIIVCMSNQAVLCISLILSLSVLRKYNLREYVSLVDGVRKGDLRTFNQSLLDYQHRFIRYVVASFICTQRLCFLQILWGSHWSSQGTYLLLEKCKTVCYRNLFLRIHFVLDKFQISLGFIAQVFKWLGMPIDLDEVECILANLIYRGYIRGYLSHTKRVLVLSKRDPFPLSSIVPK